MTTNEKLNLFQELISCNYDLYILTFDKNLNFINTNSKNKMLFREIFAQSGCKNGLLPMPKSSTPLVLSDDLGMLWISVYEKNNENLEHIHVLGPIFTKEFSISNIVKILDSNNTPIRLKKTILENIKKVPIISPILYYQYAIMLHFCVTGEKINFSDLNFYTQKSPQDTIFSADLDNSHEGAWIAEQELIKNVELGNLMYHSALHNASLVSSGVKIFTGDSLTQAKFSSVIFIALCTRAAIKGGLSPDLAYTVGDHYLQSVESSDQISELVFINHSMYEDFIRRVNKCKVDSHISLPVKSCCDYIQLHICEELLTDDIANKVGYTKYYLTRKFKEEVGMSINDYIKNKKIEYAKLLLTTSQESIQDISDKLNFCSRSYFSDTFKKIVGTPPNEYRQQNIRI